MTAPGKPLVVFSDLGLCTGREHEVRLITDGITAYAYALGDTLDSYGLADLPLIRRDGASPAVTVSCRVPDHLTDEECDGEVEFRLTDDQWTTDPEALALLTDHGNEMDR